MAGKAKAKDEVTEVPSPPPGVTVTLAPTPPVSQPALELKGMPMPGSTGKPTSRYVDQREAYVTPPAPKAAPDPVPLALPTEVERGVQILYCGECPKWKRQNPLAPFGQCLAAMRFLSAPLYTPDMSACSWTAEQRAAAR